MSEVNSTRTIKRRRRTKAEMEEVADAIYKCFKGDHPQTIRHVFYQLAGHPYYLVDKNKSGYRTAQRKCLELRKADRLPWHWVAHGTRWRRVSPSYLTPAEAIKATAESYRRDLWRKTPVYVEVWCESDSMAGVLIEEADRYNVPLMVSPGFSSGACLYSAAQEIKLQNRPTYLYYVGDWDPSGKLIPEVIERELRKFAPDCDVHFERLLVTPEQIRDWDLPTKPAKKTTHSKNFSGGTVEAEAIPGRLARQLVREAIEQHLNLREVKVIEAAEESERDYLIRIAEVVERQFVESATDD